MLPLYLGLAFLAGMFVAILVATSLRRTLMLLAMGVAAALVAYVLADARGVFEEDPQCSNECGFGALIAGVLIVGSLIGWTAGVVLGVLARRLMRVTPSASRESVR